MAKKDELKKEILIALEKRLGKKSAMPFTLLDKKRQLVVDLLYKRIIQDGKTTNENIIKRIDEMYSLVKKNTSINDEIVFNNLKKTFADVSKSQTKELIAVFNGFVDSSNKQTKDLSKVIVETAKQQTKEIIDGQIKEIEVKKPKWYKEPLELISIKNKEFFFTKSDKQKKEDVSTMSALATAFLESLISFFNKLAKQTFKVRLNQEHYTTPQAVVILDPKTMKSFDLKKLGMGDIQVFNQSSNNGSQSGGSADMTETNALLTDIKNNTDTLELNAENVNLNTDALESKLEDVKTLLNDIKLNADDVEPALNAIELQTFGLIGNLEDIKAYIGSLSDALANSGDNGSVNARLRSLSAQSESQSGFQQNIQDNTAKISAEMLKTTVSISSSGTILTPTSGKRIRIFGLKFSLTSDLTDVAFNFQGSGDFEKYLLPKAGGLYGHNIAPNYTTGDVDVPLDITINGTGTVQVNIDYQEVN